MADKIDMEDFVRQRIEAAADELAQSVMQDQDWIRNIEQRIVQHVQDRITARFANIESVPDLVQTVRESVRDLVDQGHVPGMTELVDPARLNQLIDLAVEREICRGIDALTVDAQWIHKIETLISQQYVLRLSDYISTVDINALIGQHLDQGLERWRQRLMQDFATRGIRDQAQDTELTVAPGMVSVTNALAAKSVVIEHTVDVQGCLQVKDLAVTGVINTDNAAWNELTEKMAQDTLSLITEQWQQNLVQQVLDLAQQQGINFDEVLIGGQPLVQDHVLNHTIRHSALESVGTLHRLTVAGDADVTETVHVRHRRLGINTRDPEMALSVWDEEVAVVAGKLRQDQAYLGTLRPQSLSLGVNRRAYLDIDTDGLTTVKNLRIDRHRVSFATQVPGYSGTRGDIVFNSDPNEGQPFAWVCLGAFRWQSLKAVT